MQVDMLEKIYCALLRPFVGTECKQQYVCFWWVIAWHIPPYSIAPTSSVISADMFFKIFTFIQFMKVFHTLQTTQPCMHTLAWKKAEWFNTEIAGQNWLLLKWLFLWLMSLSHQKTLKVKMCCLTASDQRAMSKKQNEQASKALMRLLTEATASFSCHSICTFSCMSHILHCHASS